MCRSIRPRGRSCNIRGVFVRAEKAGVSGSTPSLATIIPKDLAASRLALPVRYFSARSGSVDGEGLKLELLLAQSAFSPLLLAACLKIAIKMLKMLITTALREAERLQTPYRAKGRRRFSAFPL